MGRGGHAAVIVGVTLLASGVLAEEPATRLETAQWAADLNAKSPGGREWMDRNGATVGRLLMPILDRCVPEDAEEVTAFSLWVRLSRKGRIREVLTDVDAALGPCLTSNSRELQAPEPPRDDYWIRLNLAAPL